MLPWMLPCRELWFPAAVASCGLRFPAAVFPAAGVVELPREPYEIWGSQVTYIAQLELYMILAAVTTVAGRGYPYA